MRPVRDFRRRWPQTFAFFDNQEFVVVFAVKATVFFLQGVSPYQVYMPDIKRLRSAKLKRPDREHRPGLSFATR